MTTLLVAAPFCAMYFYKNVLSQEKNKFDFQMPRRRPEAQPNGALRKNGERLENDNFVKLLS